MYDVSFIRTKKSIAVYDGLDMIHVGHSPQSYAFAQNVQKHLEDRGYVPVKEGPVTRFKDAHN